ncbi:hypothetical protein RFI_30020 [Reticulomyxa filosa]|uniref:Uncharacterized protein n=1 Tax=Reticulomyxa filosa TaxID=46433 RepID=X6M0K1_RETFI|nr:hypothetical protein RFI_30020 [Reticulomyxa filosa]|eukprot:ETO07374.1 hypothetical protein RFI_30020 [Reticulomyxa filosa]
MSSEQAKTLKVHDTIDHRNKEGKFVPAEIVDKQGTKVRVHYQGTDSSSDVWSDYVKDFSRFAIHGSISQRIIIFVCLFVCSVFFFFFPPNQSTTIYLGEREDKCTYRNQFLYTYFVVYKCLYVYICLCICLFTISAIKQIHTQSKFNFFFLKKKKNPTLDFPTRMKAIDLMYCKHAQTKSLNQTSEIASGSRIIADELSKHSAQNTNCHNNNNNNNHNNNNNNNRNAYNHHNNTNNRNNNNRHNNHHNNNNQFKRKKKKKDDDGHVFDSSSDTDDEDNDSDTSKRKSRRSSSKKSSHPPFRMSSDVNIGGDRRRIAKKVCLFFLFFFFSFFLFFFPELHLVFGMC